VFYLTSDDQLLGVKLSYGPAAIVMNYLQPASLKSTIEAVINASSFWSDFEVEGYSVKAGPDVWEFGDVFDDFNNSRDDNAALAIGSFNGAVMVSAAAVDALLPIDLSEQDDDDWDDISRSSLLTDDQEPSTEPEPAPEPGPLPTPENPNLDNPNLDSSNLDNANTIVDSPGDSVLTGTIGVDVFEWRLAEPGARDVIQWFDTRSPAAGGDVIDLRDLLPGDARDNPDAYFAFEPTRSGSTLMHISVAGAFNGDLSHDDAVPQQIIELAGVDLFSLGSTQQIIETLLNQNTLLLD
jgi:hypothetical protein